MTSVNTCPSSEQLTRAAVEGCDDVTREHIENCGSCAVETESVRQLIEVGAKLPDGRPSDARAEMVLNSLMAASAGSSPPKRKPTVVWVAAAIAAGVAGLVMFLALAGSEVETTVSEPQQAVTHRAQVFAHPGASHMVMGTQPDEIVRVSNGTVTVEVDKLEPGERFRIVTGDAEVEVKGTAFDVTVENDRLKQVRVLSGVVEVRCREIAAVTLHSGELWNKPVRAKMAAEDLETEDVKGEETEIEIASILESVKYGERAESRGTTIPVPEPVVEDSPVRSTDPIETAFNMGWRALREGKSSMAAQYFAQVAGAPGADPSIVGEALFWKAVAHDRSGSATLATEELGNFLRDYPDSSRRGEACAMLGWKLVKSGNHERAAQLFRLALKDPVPRVRLSAQEGLWELEGK